MTGQHTATISFDVQVRLEDRGDRWAAYIEPPAITVYAASEDAVRERINTALDFFMEHFGADYDGVMKLRQYLDAHGVPNVVIENAPVSPIRYRRPVTFPPVTFPMEAAASA